MSSPEIGPFPSYSQAGEDRLLHFLFEMAGRARELTYVDIGAAHPDGHNNTFLFYSLGGNGVLVEADPMYLPLYQRVRPRDRVEQVAVVPSHLKGAGTITFHAMENPGWSTISSEHVAAAAQLGKGGVRESLTVRCLTINELLEAYYPGGRFDILSLDIEGVDSEVLAELDLVRFRPRAIVVENPFGLAGHPDMSGPNAEKLKVAGYRPFAWTFVNFIFVDAGVLGGICF